MEEKYILSLDIGTTTIRSFIYNSRAKIVNKAITEASKNNNIIMFVDIARFCNFVVCELFYLKISRYTVIYFCVYFRWYCIIRVMVL